MSQQRSVLVGEHDYATLTSVLKKHNLQCGNPLFDELDAASILPDTSLPGDVVTMNSVVSFRDFETKRESTVELVFPEQADAARNRISILAPVGAALIGLRVGEQIVWPLPNDRERRLEVIAVQSRRGAAL